MPGSSRRFGTPEFASGLRIADESLELVDRRPYLHPTSGCAGLDAGSQVRSRAAVRRGEREGPLADGRRRVLRRLAARAAALIRVDALRLATEPFDMRTGTEPALACVVAVFCEARPHHVYPASAAGSQRAGFGAGSTGWPDVDLWG